MAADTEHRSNPNVMYLILALLGLSTVQNLSGSGNDSAAKADKGTTPPASSAAPTTNRGGNAADPAELKVLSPLVEHFSTVRQEKDVLAAIMTESGLDLERGLQCLIVMVPDPLKSTNSHRFDEWVGAIQRACESEKYVLERSQIPWGETAGPTAPEKATGLNGIWNAAKATPRPNPAYLSDDPDKQPALFLFRGVGTKKQIPGPATTETLRVHAPLLAVFLVPETPTLGINKDVFLGSLTLARKWDVRNRDTKKASCTFNIVGPCFSGSKDSLEEGISGWCQKHQDIDSSFWVISGSTTGIDTLPKNPFPGPGRTNRVDFHTTVRNNHELLDAVFDHIGTHEETALLIEANTGFGRTVLDAHLTKGRTIASTGNVVNYPFPLHISKLRESYEKKGLLHDKESQTLRSAESLTIPFDEAGEAADIPASRTPGFTAAVDELSLNQIFADIARRKIRRVGILATDPLDVVFLTRKVRQFCPDVLLFATQSHILFTHPQHVAEMRGMLIASTYPLFPQNQLWSYSYLGMESNISFPSDAVQGTYNAVIAQLDEKSDGGILGDKTTPPHLLEYGDPFDPPSVESTGKVSSSKPGGRTPPVWLCAVGNHGLYPVKVVVGGQAGGSNYLFVSRSSEPQAESPELVRIWFLPKFPTFWTFLFWCLSIGCLLLAGINALVYWWAVSGRDVEDLEGFKVLGLPTDRLAEFLNCCQARYAAKRVPCRGPGPYPAIALVLMLTVYATATRPLLSVMVSVPWYPLQVGHAGFWFVGVAYAVIWLSVAAVVLSALGLVPDSPETAEISPANETPIVPQAPAGTSTSARGARPRGPSEAWRRPTFPRACARDS